MKTLFILLSILSLAGSCSYFYASDPSESMVLSNPSILLRATQEELDAIDQDQLNKMSHADRAIPTLHSVLPRDAANIVVDYLRPEASHPRYHLLSRNFMFKVTGIMTSPDIEDTIDITTSCIEKNHTGTYSISRGKTMYHYITDTFIHKPLSPACSNLSIQQAMEKLAKIDNQKPVPALVLPDGTTLTVLHRFLSVDNKHGHLALAHTRWLSSQVAYTQWLSRIHNKSLVKSLKWDGLQS